MDATKTAKHDQQRHPPLGRQAPQSRMPEPRQREPASESSPPLERYLGNSYLEAVAGKKQRLQTKLKVNEPGDSYEREADRIADQLLATPAHYDIGDAPPRIQRFSGESHGQVEEAPASVDDALTGPGRPLESTLRQDMEQRFGRDFSTVRVHTGAAAEQSAEDVNAHAYTVGHNIVLGDGRFDAKTHEGRRLIAHELTHVVQQSNADQSSVHESHQLRGSSGAVIAPSQPGVIGLQRKTKRSPGGSSSKQPVKGKPAQQTSSNKVSFTIHFDKPLTRSQFIELADMTIYGRPTPGEWKGVPEHLKVSDSPVVVWVPASTLEPGLRDSIAALPSHIQNFLMANRGPAGTYQDLQSVLNAGFLLEVAGVTEDELELSLLQSPKPEITDLVSWAQEFLTRRQEEAESQRKYEEREKRREDEEKELEKWRKRFAKYSDAVLDEKIAELRQEPESGTAKDWLPRYEKERARRRDARRAQPVTRPETVDQAVAMLEEAWRDAEKEDVPDVKRALELVSRIDEWLQETASSDKYDRYFKDGMFRMVARQHVGMAKEQIFNIRYKIRRQGEDDWNRPTHLGGHWDLGINSLKGAREYVEVMGAKKSIKETSLHGLQEASSRTTKYVAAGYAAVILAPVVIGTAIEVVPLLSTEALTAAGLRVAPRIMFWAARNPVLATEVGVGIVGTALQVAEDKYLDPVQLIFNILHIYAAMPGRGPSGPPAPTVPRQQGEPDFIITSAPKLDQQTGKITASVIERASGRQLDAEINVTTASGQITDRKTREVVGIINNGDISRPAPALAPPAPARAPAPRQTPALTSPAVTPQKPPAATGATVGTPAPAPQLAGKTQRAPVQVSVPLVSPPQPKNENITARTDIEKAREKRAAATRRPQAQRQRQVLAATGGTSNVAPAKVIGSSNAQGNASGVQIVASGERKPPGSGTPVAGSVQSSETNAPTRSRTPSGTRSSGEFDEGDPTNVDVLPAGASPEGAPPAPSHRVHPNVIPRPVPAQPPPAPEVAPPAPSHRVHPNVIPRPVPAQPPPAPEVAPPAPSRRVHPNVIPRPAPEPAPAAPATSSRQPGSPEDLADEPTGVLLERPGQELRGAVRPSGGGPSPAQVGTTVSGEITETPAGAPTPAAPTAANTGARLSREQPEGPQPQSPEPPVRRSDVADEPAAQGPARRTGQKLEKFDFNTLPVPEQYRSLKDKVQRFGQVIGWGEGSDAAFNLAQTLRTNPEWTRNYLEHLRGEGVTREMARAWSNAYKHDLRRNWRNSTARQRSLLMDLIASLL